MPDAVLLARKDGTIALANREATHLLGYARDEFIGLRLDLLLPEASRQRHAEQQRAYFADPTVRTMRGSRELAVLTRDGREVPVDIRLSSIETPSERLVVACLRDFSDRRLVEEQLRSALAEVEHLSHRLAAENTYLREEVRSVSGYEGIVGTSGQLSHALQKAELVAGTDTSVLLLGETGTGKNLLARAIHARSSRKDGPFIQLSCATLPDPLIESELFGHEKGAFTGAVAAKDGRFELADGGTMFLDEIGEMSADLQAKLLRVLQEGIFWRIGATKTTRVNVRVIAATNRDLHQAMKDGRFRSDLYYRLSVFPIEVPPLRDRREDIPLLVQTFVDQMQGKLGKRIEHIPRSVMERLTAYSWPGNIRELENVIERSLILTTGSTLIVEELRPGVAPASSRETKLTRLEDVERRHILSELEKCHWRIKGAGNAADRLGMKPSTLYHRMNKMRIRRPDPIPSDP